MHLFVSAEEMAAALYRDRAHYRDEAYFAVGRHVWGTLENPGQDAAHRDAAGGGGGSAAKLAV